MSTEKRPRAGHRSAASLTLVFGSVMPVTLGSVLLWGLLRVPIDAYTFLLLLVAGLLAALAPYAVGWTRGVVSLLVLTAGLGGIEYALRDQAIGWRVAAAVVFVALVAGLTYLSLRVGGVRRPADAKQWQEKRDDTWPYPYA